MAFHVMVCVIDEQGNEIGKVPVITAIGEDTPISPGPGIGDGLDGAWQAVVGAVFDTRQKLRVVGYGEVVMLESIWKVAVDGLIEAVGKAGAACYLHSVADRIEGQRPTKY